MNNAVATQTVATSYTTRRSILRLIVPLLFVAGAFSVLAPSRAEVVCGAEPLVLDGMPDTRRGPSTPGVQHRRLGSVAAPPAAQHLVRPVAS